MNEEIIFKWDREWDRKFVGKWIWKSGWPKGKSHCSFSKQYKNLEKLLEIPIALSICDWVE